MSLNRRRFTAEHLAKPDKEFTLSVPVAGMEDLVLAVGGTSGKFGSKFPEDIPAVPEELPEELSRTMSKRQKKKLEQWAKGIPGLVQVPLGETELDAKDTNGQKIVAESSEHAQEGTNRIFCVQGTVAHLHCRTYSVLEDVIDGAHLLVLAEVIDAYCRADYWEPSKNIFRSKPGTKPYLTFFGAQTLGHVVADQKYCT